MPSQTWCLSASGVSRKAELLRCVLQRWICHRRARDWILLYIMSMFFFDRGGSRPRLPMDPTSSEVVHVLQKAQSLLPEGGEFSNVLCTDVTSCRELAQTPKAALAPATSRGNLPKGSNFFHKVCLPHSGLLRLLWLSCGYSCGSPVAALSLAPPPPLRHEGRRLLAIVLGRTWPENNS